ncbi:MAG: response regulator transcription factor [Rufibacter sp.]
MTDQDIKAHIEQVIAQAAPFAEKMPGIVSFVNLRDNSVIWFSPLAQKRMNIAAEEIIGKSQEDYHATYFHPDDAKDFYPKLFELVKQNDGDIITYFRQVRYPTSQDWEWFMGSLRTYAHDADGNPLLAISISLPVDPVHHMAGKVVRLLEENNFLRQNHFLFSQLSKREKDILRELALGKSSAEIAEELFIAQATVETHKKNIKQKLNTSSYYELCQFARAFDLI